MMRPRVYAAVSAGILAVAVSGVFTTAATAHPAGIKPIHHGSAQSHGDVMQPQLCAGCIVLWDQTTTFAGFPWSGDALQSQKFGASFSMYNTRGADDFRTSATPPTVKEIFVEGNYFNTPAGGPTPQFERVRFYTDSGNGPGSAVPGATGACVGVESPPGTFDILFSSCSGPISGNVTLNASTIYWVSVVLRMNSGGGQWGWNTTTQQTGSTGYWKNPGGGFGLCTVWTPVPTCPGSLGPDFQFQLAGN